jgi:hypothetical protein
MTLMDSGVDCVRASVWASASESPTWRGRGRGTGAHAAAGCARRGGCRALPREQEARLAQEEPATANSTSRIRAISGHVQGLRLRRSGSSASGSSSVYWSSSWSQLRSAARASARDSVLPARVGAASEGFSGAAAAAPPAAAPAAAGAEHRKCGGRRRRLLLLRADDDAGWCRCGVHRGRHGRRCPLRTGACRVRRRGLWRCHRCGWPLLPRTV